LFYHRVNEDHQVEMAFPFVAIRVIQDQRATKVGMDAIHLFQDQEARRVRRVRLDYLHL
jgi:hypothetical protein